MEGSSGSGGVDRGGSGGGGIGKGIGMDELGLRNAEGEEKW
jgi:hypothetical protein